MTGLIVTLIIGAIAGWLAGKIKKGGGFGALGNIGLGLIGGFVGGHILGWFGIYTYGMVGRIVTALIGALIVLWVVGLFKKN